MWQACGTVLPILRLTEVAWDASAHSVVPAGALLPGQQAHVCRQRQGHGSTSKGFEGAPILQPPQCTRVRFCTASLARGYLPTTCSLTGGSRLTTCDTRFVLQGEPDSTVSPSRGLGLGLIGSQSGSSPGTWVLTKSESSLPLFSPTPESRTPSLCTHSHGSRFGRLCHPVGCCGDSWNLSILLNGNGSLLPLGLSRLFMGTVRTGTESLGRSEADPMRALCVSIGVPLL